MRDEVAEVILDSVPVLYAAAHNADAHAAMVAMRRLLERLRSADPKLADALKARLPAGQPTAAFALRARAAEPTLQPPRDPDSAAGLLRRIPTADAVRPVLAPDQAHALECLLREHREAEALLTAGLRPRSTLFLVGPPGVGKTMTASWLARELAAPLFQVEIPALVSSYLGRTGQNLRDVFEFARANPAVVLLDEFDAVAKRRDDSADLGEMRRVVSVLLKEIEEWPGPSLLVSATNYPDLIDPAIMRRFQLAVRLDVPSLNEAQAILSAHLGPLAVSDPTCHFAAQLLTGSSGSDIRDIAHEARRAVALGEHLGPDEALLRALGARAHTADQRRKFARLARSVKKRVSLATLAKWLGVSKTTIHNYLSERGANGG